MRSKINISLAFWRTVEYGHLLKWRKTHLKFCDF